MTHRFGLSCMTLALACTQALGQVAASPNILPNPSFEESVGGLPVGWNVEAGRGGAQWSLAEGEGRSGDAAIRVTNTAPQEPHVFGRLWTEVNLERGVTYSLSVYVRSDDPGMAWIGTGQDWQHRFGLPASDEWTRVTGTFEAEGGATPVMIVTESPTDGILIDDVQIERGERATPFLFEDPPAPGELRLEVLTLDIPRAGENLIANSSFERGEEMPRGWTFDPRNTDATMELDGEHARTGQQSLKITSGTPYGAHVYGLAVYSQEIAVEPGALYTLSASFRSTNDAIVWIGGGPDWLVRLAAPRTEGAWARTATTFRTRDDQDTFPLLIATESPTDGVWIDDIKLEQGALATPYVPEDARGASYLELDVADEVAAETSVTVPIWVWAAPDEPQASIHVTLDDGAASASAEVPEGLCLARIHYGLPPDFESPLRLEAELVPEQDDEIARVTHTLGVVSAQSQHRRLEELAETSERLRGRLHALRREGRNVAYPLASLTVLEQFHGFVLEDLAHGEIARARDQIDALETIATGAAAELDAAAAEGLPPVPRYRTSEIDIRGGAFRANVEWPDGEVETDYPVIFTGYGHFDAVKRDIELFPDYGMNIIQIEFGPNSVFPSPGVEDLNVVDRYLEYFDRAAAANVAVNLLLSPHYLPSWVYEEYEDVGGVDGGFIKFSVDSPAVRAIHERFLRLVVPRLVGHPALHSFCLSNEPAYRDARADPENRTKYNAWLLDRHGSLEAIEAAHGATYPSLDDVPAYYSQDPAVMTPQAAYDYMRFNDERFAEWHQWMAQIIHEYDPDVPLHAKIMATAFSRVALGHGTDHELFNAFSQIAGNDSWKYLSRWGGRYANDWLSQNMYFDLLRSMGGMPIFNSENHLIVDREARRVPPAHIRNVLWQAAIHGEGASTTWVWERTYADHSDFTGSIMHRPACVEAHSRTGLDLLRLGREINAFQTAPARVAIIYSKASLHYNPDCERTTLRAYEALNFTGEKIDFITERQLAEDQDIRYELILAPRVTHLPHEAHAGLRGYLRDGGRLVCIGGTPALGEYGEPISEPVVPTSEITESVPIELRRELVPLLDELPGGRRLHVVDAATGEEAWGVECRSAEADGRTFLNITNYLQEPVSVRISDMDHLSLRDPLRGDAVGPAIALEPLEVRLLAGDG